MPFVHGCRGGREIQGHMTREAWGDGDRGEERNHRRHHRLNDGAIWCGGGGVLQLK